MNNTFYELLKDKKFDKALTLLDSISDMTLREEVIAKFFGTIARRFKKDKALELLDSISSVTLREEVIAKFFGTIARIVEKDKAFELLDSISDMTLREEVIAKFFGTIARIVEKDKAFELLDSISDMTLREEVIGKFFGEIARIVEKDKALELLDSILDMTLREEVIAKFFGEIASRFKKDKALELLDSISSVTLREEVIAKFFGRIVKIVEKDKAFELLDSISDMTLKVKTINRYNPKQTKLSQTKYFLTIEIFKKNINNFEFFFKDDTNKAFEKLAYADFSKEEQYHVINNSFPKLIEIDKQKAYEFLEQLFDKKIADKIIMNNASKLIEVYLQNHKIKNRIFEIVGIVNDKKLKNQLTIDYFDSFFSVHSYKAIRNLIYLDQENQEKVIVHHFPKLLMSNLKESIQLLKRVKSQDKKEDMIVQYFEELLQVDQNIAIELLQNISNKRLIDDTIEQFFSLFLNRYQQYIVTILYLINDTELKKKLTIEACSILAKKKDIKILIELLNDIKEDKLKEQVFRDTIELLAQQKEIVSIRKILNQTQLASEIKKEIKEKYSHLIKEEMKRYVDSLNEIQFTLDSKIKESVILDAYSVMQSQESSSEELDLKEATVERLSHLLISETDKESHRELLSYLIERLKEDSSRDYSKLSYKSISESRVFEPCLFELEEFVTTPYFKQELKDFKERKETEQSISKMLGKVLKNPKIKREDVFMKRFKRLRNIKDLYVVVPHVAKADFELAQALMEKRIDKDKAQEVQKVIFLNEYQDRWSRAIEVYKRIDNFYIKVELSKKILDSFVPDFGSSFFIQAMMILDSQNIAETPNELALVAPKEVLKYYGEIEDKVENALNEIIEQIVELQRRAKSADEEDDDEWDEIEDEERRIKKVIKADDELYKLFIQKYDVESFRLLSLLHLVIT